MDIDTEDTSAADDDTFVQSFARGIQVICAFGPDDRELSVVDVARTTSLSRATVRRLLLTLVELGYVKHSGKMFSLTPKVLELGFSHVSSMSMPDAVQPGLEDLSQQLDESTSAAVLDGTDVLYIARVQARRIVTFSIDVGTRLPAYATAMGRVLLSALPDEELDAVLSASELKQFTTRTVTDMDVLRREIHQVREQGWALVEQEALEIGLRSIAAPVYRGGRIVLAINVSQSAREGSAADMIPRFREPLLLTASKLSQSLEYLAH